MPQDTTTRAFEHARSFLPLVNSSDTALLHRAAELIARRKGCPLTDCWTYSDPEVVIVCEKSRLQGVISAPGFKGPTTMVYHRLSDDKPCISFYGSKGQSVRQLLSYVFSLGAPLWLIARAR